MSSEQTRRLRNAVADALLPPPPLLVADWARQKFRLSSEYSAITGGFEPYPYQVEPLNVLSPTDPAETVVLMCGAQMMKTLTMLIFLGYVVDVDPGPMLIVQPAAEDAESFSKERVAPMIRDIPSVAGKVFESKSRDSGNTILQKRFRGGQVSLTGAVSPRGLRRRSVRYLLLDEVDGYSDTSDGDPLALAVARTSKFWNRKIVLCSTPTFEGRSRIAGAYQRSDQRQFFVPCPLCGHMQTLIWANIRWGDVNGRKIEPEDAHYVCIECNEAIPHHRKMAMLQGGEWRKQNPGGSHPGFHIWRGYSPDWPWGKLVTDPIEGFLATKDSPVTFQVFQNNILAETWKDRGEAPDYEKLRGRREDEYRLGQVPNGVVFLTTGVDIQRTWVEGYVWGWGRNKQRWLVDHFRKDGDPYGPEIWEFLTDQLNHGFEHACGAEITIQRMAVDTGHASQQVYAWARNDPARILAVDGRDRGDGILGFPSAVDVTVQGRKISNGIKLWPVNVSRAKQELYGWLAAERPASGEPFPPGWVFFPKDATDDMFKQLTAEQMVTRIIRGYPHAQWIRNGRNEALDCSNYARAAAIHVGADKWTEQRWLAEETNLLNAARARKRPEQITPPPPQQTLRPVAGRMRY